jgi:hypothetical protein
MMSSTLNGVFKRRLKRALLCIVLGAVIVYGIYQGHLARLTNTGYCHASEKYLTDEEKIRVALADLLKKYPPPVIQKQIEPNVWHQSFPNNPIYYRNTDEFLSLNQNCCKVFPTEKFMEGGALTLVEKLTGTATSIVEVNYLVRYRREDGNAHAIKATSRLHITNCGTSGTPWSPY